MRHGRALTSPPNPSLRGEGAYAPGWALVMSIEGFVAVGRAGAASPPGATRLPLSLRGEGEYAPGWALVMGIEGFVAVGRALALTLTLSRGEKEVGR